MVKDVSVAGIFYELLLIRAASFGGGVVAYLRSAAQAQVIDDREFV